MSGIWREGARVKWRDNYEPAALFVDEKQIASYPQDSPDALRGSAECLDTLAAVFAALSADDFAGDTRVIASELRKWADAWEIDQRDEDVV